MSASAPPLLVIVGPTAVGKTALAISLAQALNGEIISADSRYLYRGLDIGTAKPTAAEQAAAPHHLIDVTTPDRPWSLVDYRDAATALIEDCHRRGSLPMLVGGSGQYVRCIIEGWVIPPRPDNPALRAALSAEADRLGPGALHGWLASLDPAAAAKIDVPNVRRTIRALEVVWTTGRRFSTQRQQQPPAWRVLQLGLTRPRAELYARVDARVEAMIASGLVAECQALLDAGYGWDLPAMSSLGYKQMAGVFRGEYDVDEAVRLIKRETRRFVRQQGAWFNRNDPAICWVNPGTVDAGRLAGVLARWQALGEFDCAEAADDDDSTGTGG